MSDSACLDYSLYLKRYAEGEWRATIFRDLIVTEIEGWETRKPTVLDIGCGKGFDDDPGLQKSIAMHAGDYLGVEPDKAIELGPIFSSVSHCLFEEAPIASGSVDIAFAVMVIEHLPQPQLFWDKLFDVLRPGGVFWGFSMDTRHWFVNASNLTKKLGIKDWYLDRLHGNESQVRYENYPVYYRSNNPQQINELTKSFQSTIYLNFRKVGQLDYYFPARLRYIGRCLDTLSIIMGRPGSIMAVRVEK